jgi:hypothetical protein
MPPWAKSAHDILSHGYAHYLEDGEGPRRHAFVAFDQSIEVAIQSYVELELRDPVAKTKAFDRLFKPKLDYLRTQVVLADDFRGSFSGMTYRHQLRNRVFHWAGWWVPEPADVEAARRDAVAVLSLVTALELEDQFARRSDVRRSVPETLPLKPLGRMSAARGRNLAAAAHDIAQRLDPVRGEEGLHFREISEALDEIAPHIPAEDLYWILNSAQDRFDSLGNGMFRWLDEPVDIAGLSGKPLAETAWEWARINDPLREGRHYDRQIKPGLLAAGLRVRGRKPGATMYAALSGPKAPFERVEGKGGVFRWLERVGPEPGDSTPRVEA